ncbi:MAG: 3-keto-5-aminohexanoate cleavage protein [Thermodesulfobacteriota bacterium]|nr:3-keto-5-aminohexanoate cleavage protein [Thermodesulfobacteriota bacterium]
MSNNPLVITCALIGAELTREDTPYLCLTPDELAQSAQMAVKAGACIIHLHVRDEQGMPSQRTDIFKEVSEKIKARCDCILQYSTGGAVGTPLAQRCAPLKLKPEMATLSMGTMNFGPDIFENPEETIKTIADTIKKNSIMPELEIFDLGMLDTTFRYMKKGLIPERFHINFVLGVPGGLSGDIRNLVILVDRLKSNQTWSVAGIGRFQLPLAIHALAMGGHVRVGFEDNIYYHKEELAKSNPQLIDRIIRIAREFGRPIATVKQTRRILGL